MTDKFKEYRKFGNFCNMYGSILCKNSKVCNKCAYTEDAQDVAKLAGKSKIGPVFPLTKRQHFAFEFAKMVLNEGVEERRRIRKQYRDNGCRGDLLIPVRTPILDGVKQADELIKALNEEEEDG